MAIIVFCLGGCDAYKHLKYHDPHLEKQPDDYNQLTAKEFWPKAPFQPPSPIVPPALIFPKAFDTRVTLTIIDQVPVREALIMLAEQAGVNLTIAQNVTGDTALSLHGLAFGQALDDLCQSHNLRFRLKGQGVLVEKDTPFLKTYTLSFLGGKRDCNTQVSLATDVSSSLNKGDDVSKNGSKITLNSAATNDFWEDVRQNIQMILQTHDGCYVPEAEKSQQPFRISESGGIVAISASEGAHKSLAAYFKLLSETAGAQVLIEIKILDVELSDDFKSGINWHSLKRYFTMSGTFGSTVLPGALDAAINPGEDVLRLGRRGAPIQSVLGFLKKFGTVRTLSSPRLTVMNHQSAVMKVATNRVFFRIEYTREPGTTSTKEVERSYSQIHTVPVGFLMTVRPAVSLETGKITLHLRPSMSKVSAERSDPSVGLFSNQKIKSEIPEIQVRELETVLSADSGETLVMGGLMEERAANVHTGLPGSQKIPLFGPLLSGKTDSRTVSELVIFLRASIVKSATHDTVAPADSTLYKTFSQDPRGFY